MTLAARRFLVDSRWRVFFAAGFPGPSTTFSTYTFETITLLEAGDWRAGLVNRSGRAGLGGAVVVMGVVLGRIV